MRRTLVAWRFLLKIQISKVKGWLWYSSICIFLELIYIFSSQLIFFSSLKPMKVNHSLSSHYQATWTKVKWTFDFLKNWCPQFFDASCRLSLKHESWGYTILIVEKSSSKTSRILPPPPSPFLKTEEDWRQLRDAWKIYRKRKVTDV